MSRPGPRPLIMGILNVTPDSFSDGGSWEDTGAAVEQAVRLRDEGADIIDIGGESTRPGASRVAASVQIDRVVPVIEAVSRIMPDVCISIDTTLAQVADAAIRAGASMINDISAGRDDADMLGLAASKKCTLVLMHMQGTPARMQDNPEYIDVVEEVYTFLSERAGAARLAGVPAGQIIIDPGFGFGKTADHNITLLNHLQRFTGSGHPVLIGASRKRFLKALCDYDQSGMLAGATCATTVLGVLAGVSIFRVHDVRENRQAADITYRVIN